MKDKLTLIGLLFKDLMDSFKTYLEFEASYGKEWGKYKDGQLGRYPVNENFMNKNHGKTALKRKITFLRQELLNLEKRLDANEN